MSENTNTPSTPPTGEPSAPVTHPTDRKLTIIVAWIAAAAVLFGGIIAAASSYWTAKVTSDATKSLDLDNYRREERKEAYSSMLASITKLENAERDQLSSVTLKIGTNQSEDVLVPIDQAHEALDAFSDSLASVELIGSYEVNETLSKVHTSHLDVFNSWIQLQLAGLNQPPNQQAVDQAKSDYDEKKGDASKSKYDFIFAAKEDLKLND